MRIRYFTQCFWRSLTLLTNKYGGRDVTVCDIRPNKPMARGMPRTQQTQRQVQFWFDVNGLIWFRTGPGQSMATKLCRARVIPSHTIHVCVQAVFIFE